jgi:hypothetical protein
MVYIYIYIFHNVVYQKEGYNMFIFYNFCIRKSETVSHLQYVYDRDFVYQKEGNCVMPTVCLWSRFCVSERGKLCHAYIIFMF